MERSYSLASSLEMMVEGFGLLHCFIKEGIAKTIGLNIHGINSSLFLGGYAIPVAELLQRVYRTRP
jgi:hypothetical protein